MVDFEAYSQVLCLHKQRGYLFCSREGINLHAKDFLRMPSLFTCSRCAPSSPHSSAIGIQPRCGFNEYATHNPELSTCVWTLYSLELLLKLLGKFQRSNFCRNMCCTRESMLVGLTDILGSASFRSPSTSKGEFFLQICPKLSLDYVVSDVPDRVVVFYCSQVVVEVRENVISNLAQPCQVAHTKRKLHGEARAFMRIVTYD